MKILSSSENNFAEKVVNFLNKSKTALGIMLLCGATAMSSVSVAAEKLDSSNNHFINPSYVLQFNNDSNLLEKMFNNMDDETPKYYKLDDKLNILFMNSAGINNPIDNLSNSVLKGISDNPNRIASLLFLENPTSFSISDNQPSDFAGLVINDEGLNNYLNVELTNYPELNNIKNIREIMMFNVLAHEYAHAKHGYDMKNFSQVINDKDFVANINFKNVQEGFADFFAFKETLKKYNLQDKELEIFLDYIEKHRLSNFEKNTYAINQPNLAHTHFRTNKVFVDMYKKDRERLLMMSDYEIASTVYKVENLDLLYLLKTNEDVKSSLSRLFTFSILTKQKESLILCDSYIPRDCDSIEYVEKRREATVKLSDLYEKMLTAKNSEEINNLVDASNYPIYIDTNKLKESLSLFIGSEMFNVEVMQSIITASVEKALEENLENIMENNKTDKRYIDTYLNLLVLKNKIEVPEQNYIVSNTLEKGSLKEQNDFNNLRNIETKKYKN